LSFWRWAKAHDDACEPAIIHFLKQALHGDGVRYKRLSSCHLRICTSRAKALATKLCGCSSTKTQPVCHSIGVRKAPCPNGRAGFVRIDCVYQSDEDGMKAADHITRVDSISQWQVEACVQGISEAFLRPVLERVIAQFPFVIEGFHSDNGSGYINCKVAEILGKPRIESVWGNCSQQRC
jgi:hypothetical protein